MGAEPMPPAPAVQKANSFHSLDGLECGIAQSEDPIPVAKYPWLPGIKARMLGVVLVGFVVAAMVYTGGNRGHFTAVRNHASTTKAPQGCKDMKFRGKALVPARDPNDPERHLGFCGLEFPSMRSKGKVVGLLYDLIKPNGGVEHSESKDWLGNVDMQRDGDVGKVSFVHVAEAARGHSVCKPLLYNSIKAMDDMQKFRSLKLTFVASPARSACFCYLKVAQSLGFKDFSINGKAIVKDDGIDGMMDICDGEELKSNDELYSEISGHWVWKTRE